jgi:hypothetical protein
VPPSHSTGPSPASFGCSSTVSSPSRHKPKRLLAGSGELARDKSSDLVEDVFTPGETHLIGGASGAGKTAFEVWMCGTVMRGEPFLGQPTHCPPWWGAIIVDRGMQARKQFWEAAGLRGVPYQDYSGEPFTIPYYCLTEDPKLSPDSLAEMIGQRGWNPTRFLASKVKAMNPPPGGVLTIDVANFFGSDSKHGYDKSFVSGWGINRIALDFQLTGLGLMHGSKQKKGDAYVRLVDRMIAGSGFIGSVGTSSYLTSYQETDDNGLQEFEWQSHYRAPARFKLKRTPEGLFEVVEQVILFSDYGQGQAVKDPERWDCYLNWIPLEGSGRAMSTEQIKLRAQQPDLNWSKRTVDRDLAVMEERGLICLYQGKRGQWQRKQRVGVEQSAE